MFRAIRVKHYIAKMKERGFTVGLVLAGSEIKPGRFVAQLQSLAGGHAGDSVRLNKQMVSR